MKNYTLFILTAVLLMSCSSESENTAKETAKFKVYGNCGMCKKTIERVKVKKTGFRNNYETF